MPFAERGRVALPVLRVIRAAPLGDVVEEARQVEELRLGQGVEDVRAVGQLGAEVRAAEAAQVRDGPQEVLVHGTGVEQVELHEARDPAEFGQVAAEEPAGVHAPERAGEPARLAQDLQEEASAGGVAPEPLVHQVQAAADLPDRRRPHAAQVGAPLEEQEDLEQRGRMAPEHPVVHDLDPPAANLEPPVEGPRLARAALAVQEALAKELEQQLVQPPDGLHGPVVALHEPLDAEVVVGVAIPEMGRDLDLPIEEQAVLAASGEVVQRGPRPPEEVPPVAQAPELLLGQEAVVEEVAEPGCSSPRP